jgi:exonuclease III
LFDEGAGPCGIKTRSFDEGTEEDMLSVIYYNVHSLICFEERMDRILQELGKRHWDVLVFSETWREEDGEAWTTTHGHTWFGSGGNKGQRGIGFLLHHRWKHESFRAISSRAAFLDVRIRSVRYRIFGLYFPHALMPDDEVEAVYASIESDVGSARKKGYSTIIAGDFNAEIGHRRPEDDPDIIGENQMPHRSERGELLLQWCEYKKFVISNSYGCGDWNMSWTFKNEA